MAATCAPMPGKVLKIHVGVGNEVTLDTEVVILESMKMELPLYPENAGQVKEVKVKEGDMVNAGDVLLVIE